MLGITSNIVVLDCLYTYTLIGGGSSSRPQNHVGHYWGPTVLNRFKGTVLVRRAYVLGFRVWGTYWDVGYHQGLYDSPRGEA